ncbi:hypothetical protein [Streptomyces fagopyri]|uniref:hypothetical protein n=1 Tax=Streptomyces fagopyri TaxID=2662397 RepID=UPI0038021330
MQDWWRDQAPATGVTVRDDRCQEVFRPLPIHLVALDDTLKGGRETAAAADTRIGVELAVQDGTPHVRATFFAPLQRGKDVTGMAPQGPRRLWKATAAPGSAPKARPTPTAKNLVRGADGTK